MVIITITIMSPAPQPALADGYTDSDPLCGPHTPKSCSHSEKIRYQRFRTAFDAAERNVEINVRNSLPLFQRAQMYARGDRCAVSQLDDLIWATRSTIAHKPYLTGAAARDEFDKNFQKRWLKNPCDRL